MRPRLTYIIPLMAITGLRGAPGGRHTASPKGLLCINPELRFIGPLSQDQDALTIARDFGYVWSQNWTYTWYANYCCSGTTYDECVFWLLDQGPTSLAKFVRLQQGVPAVKCIVIVVGTKTDAFEFFPCSLDEADTTCLSSGGFRHGVE